MRLQRMIKVGISVFSLMALSWGAMAQTDLKGDTFRTPAKRYGAAYSVKLTLKRGVTEYVTTMWVKPDQAESTLDYGQMRELGWSEPLDSKRPYMIFDDASLAGVPIEKTSFKNQKTEWAYVPDFPRSCCYGVIGRDVLSQYREKFVPKNPSHIEWTKNEIDPKMKWSSAFLSSLSNLFSFKSEQGTYQKQKIDLGEVGYTLDWLNGKVTFEPAPQNREEKNLSPRSQAILTFYFVPPVRKAKIESISASVAKSAKRVGIKPGMQISHINGQSLFLLDQFEVQAYLKGKRTALLSLTIDGLKRPVAFDFKKGEFVGQ